MAATIFRTTGSASLVIDLVLRPVVRVDEAALFEHAEVVGDEALRLREHIDELADAVVAVEEQEEDPEPNGVAEELHVPAELSDALGGERGRFLRQFVFPIGPERAVRGAAAGGCHEEGTGAGAIAVLVTGSPEGFNP